MHHLHSSYHGQSEGRQHLLLRMREVVPHPLHPTIIGPSHGQVVRRDAQGQWVTQLVMSQLYGGLPQNERANMQN